ncbi:hypothetical protein J6590_048969 [Homalodisca vitripennis]|nr:hypothetical protein J6590_048969 [Homalodisca vitripennis]
MTEKEAELTWFVCNPRLAGWLESSQQFSLRYSSMMERGTTSCRVVESTAARAEPVNQLYRLQLDHLDVIRMGWPNKSLSWTEFLGKCLSVIDSLIIYK